MSREHSTAEVVVSPRWWAVDVHGFTTAYFWTETRDRARYLAFKSLHECGYVATFRDFLDRVSDVRAVSADEVRVWS